MPWLFLAYPLLAHLATLVHSERLAWAALTVFAAVPLLPALRQRKSWAWLSLLVISALLYGCASSGVARYLMFLPPILIPSSVLWVFLHSLRAGEVPLVTRIAMQVRGTLPAELLTYTRRVTQFWVGLLAMLALSSVLFAVFATAAFWSLMTNIVQYLLLASVFLLEYLYRRIRFRHLPHENFATFVGALFTARVR